MLLVLVIHPMWMVLKPSSYWRMLFIVLVIHPLWMVLKPSSYWRMSMFTMMWRWLIESRVLGGEGMRHELLRQTVFLWGGQAWVLWAKTPYNSLSLWFLTGITNDSEWWWSVLLTLTHPRADRRAECWLIVVGVADARETTGPRPDWPTAS